MISTKPWHLLLLSAKTQSALERANTNLMRHFVRKPDLNLEHAAFTLQIGRELFNYRKVIVCRDLADAVSGSEAPQRTFAAFSKEKDRKVVFLLADHERAVDRIREISAVEATFKNEVDRCLNLLHTLARLDLSGEIFPTTAQTGNVLAAPDRIIAERSMQFIAGYALAMQWMSWGVKPIAMVAVGIGEYVATVLAGACSLEDALKLLVSPAHEALHTFAADGVTLSPAQIPFLSVSRGFWIGEGESAVGLPNPVAQSAGVILNDSLMAKLANSILLEVGFGHQLTTEIQRACSQSLNDKFAFVNLSAHCGARDEDCFALMTALGRLCLYGAAIDWKSLHHGRAVRRIPLPAYPFAQERFSLIPGKTHQEADVRDAPVSPAIKSISDSRATTRQAATERSGCHLRPELENDYVAPRDEIEMQLVEMCGALLNIENIGMEDNIITLRADSMFTIQLSNRIAQTFAVEISPHHLFERPNLQSLTDQIKAKMPVLPVPATQRASSVNDRHRSSAVLEKSDDLEAMIGKMTEEEVDAMLMRFALAG